MDYKMPHFKKIPKSSQKKTLEKVKFHTDAKDIANALKKTLASERRSGVTASRPKAVKSDRQKSVKAYKSKK